MSILLTGGSGLLGQELQKHITGFVPQKIMGIRILDIIKPNFWIKEWFKDIKLIVNCAAFTDLVRAEKERDLCYQTNVIGTRNLASLGIPMLYISTEYVFDGEKGMYEEDDYPNPLNFYALTKLLGEYESRRTKSVVVRCLFKPRPFKHDAGCINQFTSGDYVDVIAKDIVLAIKEFNHLPATIHIGTGRKSTYDLAKQSRDDVQPITVEEIISVKLPKDTSLNTSKWEAFKYECGFRKD